MAAGKRLPFRIHQDCVLQHESKRIQHLPQQLEEELSIVAKLKSHTHLKDLPSGNKTHADILKRGLLKKDTFVGSALISLYVKCGALAKAQEVFDELFMQDIVSWNALISGYTQHGHYETAFYCFEQMQNEDICPTAVSFACILKACGSIGRAEKGLEIHAEIVRKRLLQTNGVLGTAIVDMYCKCAALRKAQQVFDELFVRDVVCWNALISGYAHHGQGEEALSSFEQMKSDGFSGNMVTFLSVVKACSIIKSAKKGMDIHAEIIKEGLLVNDRVLGTALVDMYIKCGGLSRAHNVFNELHVRDVVSWNALMAGYCQHDCGTDALKCFNQMQDDKLSPNSATFLCVLQACGSTGMLEKGEEIHAEIVRKGLLVGEDIVLGNALVDMYAKCGALFKAKEALDELLMWDKVSWTALIAGYCQYGYEKEALDCLEQMQGNGLSPDAVTFACILNACASIGAAEKGMEIHNKIMEASLLDKDNVLASALVDMYAKCSAVSKAQEVFNNLSVRGTDTWTALIMGYAQAGKHTCIFEVFNRMVQDVVPNEVTFMVMLYACGSLGLMEEGQRYFEAMGTTYGVIPNFKHHGCMVDVFGRAGHLDTAIAVMKKTPLGDHLAVWFPLLEACRKWGYAKLGETAFECAVQRNAASRMVPSCVNCI